MPDLNRKYVLDDAPGSDASESYGSTISDIEARVLKGVTPMSAVTESSDYASVPSPAHRLQSDLLKSFTGGASVSDVWDPAKGPMTLGTWDFAEPASETRKVPVLITASVLTVFCGAVWALVIGSVVQLL